METGFMNRITGLVIALVVGGLLVGGLLIPSIEGMTATETTFENEGIYYIVDDSTSHTLVFDDQKVIVDGKEVNHPNGEYTVLATDDLLFRLTSGGERLQLRGALNGSVASCNITIADGTVSGSYVNPSDQTTSIERAYTSYWLATSDEEPLIMKAYSGTAHIKDDSVVMGRGLTRLMTGTNTDVWEYMTIDATVNGGVTINPITGFTYSDIQLNVTPVEGYNGLYSFGSITFTATHTDSGATTNVTYTAVILPAEVTAEKSQHMDATQIAMFGVISILGIVALVVVAANGIRNKY